MTNKTVPRPVLCKPHGVNMRICLQCFEAAKDRANEDRPDGTRDPWNWAFAFQEKLEEFLHRKASG